MLSSMLVDMPSSFTIEIDLAIVHGQCDVKSCIMLSLRTSVIFPLALVAAARLDRPAGAKLRVPCLEVAAVFFAGAFLAGWLSV